MNRTRTILIASLATAGLAGFAAQAATTTDATPTASGTQAWHGRHHGGHFMHVLKQLNLTAEQQTQIHGILAAAKTQFQSLRSSSQSTNETMGAMSPTDSGYPALLATAKANAAKRLEQMSAVKTQIYSVLTPAQIGQIPQIMAADKAKWQQRRQNPASSASTPGTSS
jgi:Spy/CpxP family protein refolding chaperone